MDSNEESLMAGHTRRVATLPVPHTNTLIQGERKRSASDRGPAPHIPEPFQSISAQQLVQENCRHCGMIRKESGRVRMWQDRYLILHKGCLYYYSSPEASSAQGQFALSGYRALSAPEKTKYQWTFKLVHYQPEKRTYFFAAHSEREMNTWMDSIREDIAEYASYDSRDEMVEATEEQSDEAPEECDGTEEYSYPEVEPMLTKEEFILRCSATASASRQNTNSEQPLYCPPPDFEPNSPSVSSTPSPTTTLQTSTPSPSLHRKTKPLPPPPTKSPSPKPGKSAVQVSPALELKKENLWQASLKNPPPAVPPRKMGKDQEAKSPSTPPRIKPRKEGIPTPTPKDPKPSMKHLITEMNQKLALTNSGNRTLDEPDEGYLDVVPDEEETCLQRGLPDGESVGARSQPEVPGAVDVLPLSAKRLDLNKSSASLLLQSKKGMYVIHSSQSAQSKQAISVCTGDKVRPYLIFHDQELGFALDPKGNRFRTIKELIAYYYDNNLPTCDARLSRPYVN